MRPWRRATSIGTSEFEQMIAGGKVIEQAYGAPSAVLAADGRRFIKIWQRRRGFSSDLMSPYGVRFCRNCERLKERDIAAPVVHSFHVVQPGGQHVAVYDYMPGMTMQSLAEKGRDLPTHGLAAFYVDLHAKGIYFRSIHLGNILQLDDGRFALIDVTDTRFYRSALSPRRRARNLAYAWTRPRLRHLLPVSVVETLLSAYREVSDLNKKTTNIFRGSFVKRCRTERISCHYDSSMNSKNDK